MNFEGGRFEGMASTADGLTAIAEDIAKCFTYPIKIKIDECGSTLDYKALLAIWFRAMAEQFTARDRNGKTYSDEEIRRITYHKFFGYTESEVIGKTEIKPALITITYPQQKTRGELYHFCRQIEGWCSEVGVTLPEKESQYSQDKAKEAA